MHFTEKKVHFKDVILIILPIFNSTTTIIGSFTKKKTMDSYIITLGTYLILMLFFKVFFAVAGKE